MVGVTAMPMRPLGVAWPRKPVSSERTSRRMRSAIGSISCAASVGLSERVVRSNRLVPVAASSWRTSTLTAECVR